MMALQREARNLAPLVLGAAGLLCASLLVPDDLRPAALAVSFAVCCALIGVASFGVEFVHGTCPQLLGLPIPRGEVWRDKLIVQVTALGLLAALFAGLSIEMEAPRGPLGGGMLLAAPLVALAGGSLLVAYLRNMAGAFMMLLGWGAALFFALGGFVPGLVAIAIAGQWWFRRRLFRFENHSRMSQELNLFPTAKTAGKARIRGVWLTLLAKELRLQQVTLVVVALGFGVPLLLHFVLGFVASVVWDVNVQFIRDAKKLSAFVGNVFVLGIPVLVGTAAIIEERRNNVHRWQAILLPGRARQWMLKVAIAIPFALALGWIVLHTAGADMFASRFWQQDWIYPAYATTAVLLSILMSTTAANYFGALLRALLLVPVMLVLSFIALHLVGIVGLVSPWNLLGLIYVPLVAVYAVMQGQRNFVSLETGSLCMRRTLTGLASRMALAVVVTILVYHRTWEWFEPARQAAAARPMDAVKIQGFFSDFRHGQAIDPQGRLWQVNWPENPEMPTFAQIGEDSDWKQVVQAYDSGFAALKHDGSVWVQAESDESWSEFPKQFAPITPGHRWAKIDFDGWRLLGLKEDGTLWFYGSGYLKSDRFQNNPRVESEPVRLGKGWKDLVVVGRHYQSLAVKTDGSLWQWGRTDHGRRIDYNPEPIPHPSYRDVEVVKVRKIRMGTLALLADGRIVSDYPGPSFQRYTRKISGSDLWRVDPRIRWDRIGFFDGHATTAITGDNRWLNIDACSHFVFSEWYPDWFLCADRATDWVATGARDGIGSESMALKQDGTLWHLGHPPQTWGELKARFIPPRHRPQLIGRLPVQFFEPINRKAAR